MPPVNLDIDGDGNSDVVAPYYLCSNYQSQFNELITTIKTHINTVLTLNHNDDITNAFKKIVGLQGCYGSTGDYISYKGTPQYAATGNYCGQASYVSTPLTNADFTKSFDTFSLYYQRAYYSNGIPQIGLTGQKVHILQNPSNNGVNDDSWLQQNCPGTWRKAGDLGKIYQLNNEWDLSHTSSDDISWWYTSLNSSHGTDPTDKFIRARSELVGGITTFPWWTGTFAPDTCGTQYKVLRSPQVDWNDRPYKNLFTLYAYMLHWGVDWANPTPAILEGTYYNYYKPALQFYNKYAGQKDTLTATNGFCMLRDGLDANDGTRFIEATYGPRLIGGNINIQRFYKIDSSFKNNGALLETPCEAAGDANANRNATGINDVGWNIIPGNYDRYVYQIAPLQTSAGYWNVKSSAQPNSIFGRFARGFDHSHFHDSLFFDIDGKFLDTVDRINVAPNGYHVMLKFTYLDSGATFGTARFRVYYDKVGTNGGNTLIKTDTIKNTKNWITDSIEITDGYFGNRGTRNADFSFRNIGNNSNIIFSLIEVEKRTSLQPIAKTSSQIRQQQNNIEIHPNPALTQFTVSTGTKEIMSVVSVYSQTGVLLFQKKVYGSSLLISKQEIGNKPGIYFVKVISNGNVYTKELKML